MRYLNELRNGHNFDLVTAGLMLIFSKNPEYFDEKFQVFTSRSKELTVLEYARELMWMIGTSRDAYQILPLLKKVKGDENFAKDWVDSHPSFFEATSFPEKR